MPRQSINLAGKNEEWLKQQVEDKKFATKSEAINDLIQRARQQKEYHDFVQMKIDRGIKSGCSTFTKEELLAKIKSKYNNV